MLRQTFINALITGFSQVISLLVIIALASVLEAERFGILSLQLSAAALLSIICTLQFERVYVRVRSQVLAHYIAFHLRCLLIVSLTLFLISLSFEIGPSSLFLAVSISLSQIALYAAARQGYFRRIWFMKALQATALLILSIAIYFMGYDELYWMAFLGSYLSSGLVVFDKSTRSVLTSCNLRNDMRRFTYSLRIAAMALGSLLSGSFTREFPVLLSGVIGQVETAGVLGLIMRTVGAPVGFFARSASAVVSSYVASNHFDIRAMGKLLVIPAIGAAYVLLLFVVSFYISAFTKFDQFRVLLIALAPFFVTRAYVGMLGSALVFYRLQHVDLLFNAGLALVISAAGILAYAGIVDIEIILWIISLLSIVLGGFLVHMLAQRLKD